MSMTMPPDYAPGLPTPPGGGDPMAGGPAPPQDALNGQPLPSQGGLDGLMAALGGGGGDPSQGGPPGLDPSQGDPGAGGADAGPTDAAGHIQEAMKHLMMALSMEPNEQQGLGITKGMGALQAILAGKQKDTGQLSALQGPSGQGSPGPQGG